MYSAGPPKMLYIEGMKPDDRYLDGDVLECGVDSNPHSFIRWLNMRNSQYINSSKLTVDPNWVNNQFQCSAQNVINGYDYSTSVVINITVTGECILDLFMHLLLRYFHDLFQDFTVSLSKNE